MLAAFGRNVRPALARCPGWYLLPALAVALLWVYWPTLAELAGRWSNESRYSHGFLVPLFAVFLLWARRDMLPALEQLQPSWWGLLVLAAGLGVRFVGVYIYQDSIAGGALLPMLAGLALLVGGWPILRWSSPAIFFLIFMLPLPMSLEVALARPLQRLASMVSTYNLQTLGLVVFAEGNVIRGEVELNVAEACSGLAMLMTFFALSTAVTLVSKRPPLERALLFVSAIPIALVANITRITATGLVQKAFGPEWGEPFHDFFGYLMPVMGLALMWAEIGILAWVLVPRPSSDLNSETFAWATPRRTRSASEGAANPGADPATLPNSTTA